MIPLCLVSTIPLPCCRCRFTVAVSPFRCTVAVVPFRSYTVVVARENGIGGNVFPLTPLTAFEQ